MTNVVLLLPTYNEKGNIETLIETIEAVFSKLPKYSLQILVVDDYSPDGTAEIAKKLADKHENITLLSKKKEGLGAAYIFGIQYAIKHLQPDAFIQIDADWQHDPRLLPDFFRELEKGAHLVIGSRYIPGGSIPGTWGIHRKIYSILGNAVVRFGLGMLNPHDWTSGYRLYKREVFERVQTGLQKYSGYTFQVAFLHRAKQAGFKIAEVPLKFIDRLHGKSKIAPFDYIKNLILYILHNSTFVKYVVIGLIGFTIQTLISKLLVEFIHPGLAVAIGSIFAMITNFLGNNLWTFSHKRIHGIKNLLQKFVHFSVTSIGAVILQGVVVGVGVWILGKDAWFLLMVFAIAFLVIPYNFFVYNRFIWKTHKGS